MSLIIKQVTREVRLHAATRSCDHERWWRLFPISGRSFVVGVCDGDISMLFDIVNGPSIFW